MNLIDHSIVDFINQVDSKQPAPGGGSVSALSSVLGVSLARMMGHVTIGRKAYRTLSNDIQSEIQSSFDTLEQLKQQLIPLIDQDAEAFNSIMHAYRLPKETEEEQHLRFQAIQDATIGAIEVPLSVATLSIEALKQIKPLMEYGNTNALSDIKVAVLELITGAKGAVMNMEINLSGLSDPSLQKHYHTMVDTLQKEIAQYHTQLL